MIVKLLRLKKMLTKSLKKKFEFVCLMHFMLKKAS